MHTLPTAMIQLLAPFALLFSERVWRHAQVLLAGMILAPGKRTVGAALRVMGLGRTEQYQRYHRVLNRAAWSSREASRVLLGLLVKTFLAQGEPLVIGLDETLERRWGKKIAAKGIYRDPVRSSHGHFVKASGLRWVCLMLLVPVPWASRVWALPFLSVLAPSERYAREQGKKPHKKLTDWARQMLLLVRRWWPKREIVAVADSGYACIRLLAACRRLLPKPVTFVTRLRLDAALYEPAPPRKPKQIGRPRLKGKRLPTLATVADDPSTIWTPVVVADWYGKGERTVEVASATAVWYHTGLPPVPLRWVLVRDPQGEFAPQALLCTDLGAEPARILSWFVLRWQMEVTFQEARRHLGVETQRQWSDLAIRRTTPALLGLFSLVTLFAHRRMAQGSEVPRQASWYRKSHPTFSDALALVRRELWAEGTFCGSAREADMVKVPRVFVERLTETLCYAA
ncbi:MAG: transposase [Rubrobacteraceae bacterium]|nr:transposase [Rubrobacteraceae bacterium]